MGNLKISVKNNYDKCKLKYCDSSTVFILAKEGDKNLEQRTVYIITTLLDKHTDNICIDLNTGKPAYFSLETLVLVPKEIHCYMRIE